MFSRLATIVQPKPTLTDEEVAHGLKMMTYEGITSMAMFSVTTSGLLAAFALGLGANNTQIGLMASLPFITQLLQIPAIPVVERFRRRKAIALLTWTPAQSTWILMALIPLVVTAPSTVAVALLLALLALRGILGSFTNCAWNGWLRDLVPQNILGTFFSRRLALSTMAAVVFGLGGAFFVDFWRNRTEGTDELLGYTFVLLIGGIVLGLGSPFFMSRIPEPAMPPVQGPKPSLVQTLATPLKDRNFRQLVNFLVFWGFAVNLAVPFFTIYMLVVLEYPIGVVIVLNTLAQLTNVLFVRVWGTLADKFGSKVVLSSCVSLYLLVILGWAFTTMPDKYFLTPFLVVILQVFAGIAVAGVTLTTGTIGMKLAPQGQATSFMAAATMALNLGAGLGPIAGGIFVDFFETRQFAITFEWISNGVSTDLPVLHLQGFDFLFGISFLIGLVTVNTLTTLREEGEVERGVVLEELMAPTREMTRSMGSIAGLQMLGAYPLSYLRRVPGMDVAMGVTAYQVASSVKTAVTMAGRGEGTALQIAGRVSRAVQDAASQVTDLGERGVNLAMHTARGAIMAVEDIGGDLGDLAKGTMVGVLGALGRTPVDKREAIRAAAQGALLGAEQTGSDLGEVAAQAVEGAMQVASELGLSSEEAAWLAAQGVLDAADAIGPEAVSRVRNAIPNDVLAGLPGDGEE